jgi:arylsulfatase A
MSGGGNGVTRRALLLGGAAMVSTAALARQAVQRRPPNIILILADDMGIASAGPYGSEIATPALSALAANGLRIDNAHAMPLCTPTRARLLTGRDSSRNYRDFGHLDERETTIAELLQRAGYRTMVAGKWQLGRAWSSQLQMIGTSPAAAGFDEYIVHQIDGNDVGSRYWGPTLVHDGKIEVNEGRVYGSDLVSDAALQFVEANKDRPFFLFYSMFEPHDPFVETPDMPPTGDRTERYKGMVRYMDKLVAKLVARIEALGLGNDTLIIFTADNGTHPTITIRRDGVPQTGGKGRTIDAGTHVPFIAAWPGVIAPGRNSDALVDIADLFPTFAELGGVKNLPTIDGRSLVPLLNGKTDGARTSIIHSYKMTASDKPQVYAFDARHKVYADGRFFDRQTDPGEERPIGDAALTAPQRVARDRLQEDLRTIAAN